jgi:hypothetical protein
MNFLGDSITAALTASSEFQALCGTRVFPQVRPQTAAFPVMVYSIISDVPENSQDGSAQTRLSRARVQCDCYAKTYKQAHELAAVVDSVLGNLDAPDLAGFRENSRDLYDNEAQLHRVSLEFMISR